LINFISYVDTKIKRISPVHTAQKYAEIPLKQKDLITKTHS